MSHFKNKGLMVQEYVYDFSVSAGAQGTIDLSALARKDPLPDKAIVQKVIAYVETALTSGGSAVLSWGNTTDADGYSGTAQAVAGFTADAAFNGWDNGAALLWDDTNDHPIDFVANSANDRVFSFTIGTADLTAGKIRFLVYYALPGAEA